MTKTWITRDDALRAFQRLGPDEQGRVMRAAERGARATDMDVRDWLYLLAKTGAYVVKHEPRRN